MLDYGATNHVREVKRNESYKRLTPIEVEVAFDPKVKAKLFMNPCGTIIGPEVTETIASMNGLVKAGYEVASYTGELIVAKDGERLSVKIRSGIEVLPNEICLKLIEP